MRLVVLTCVRRDVASRCLPALCANPKLVVDRVILAHGGSPGKWRLRRRKLAKLIRIGPLGAWNGVRMRPWFADHDAPDIGDVCRGHGVPLYETDYLNCERTRELFRESKADLGLSLGNGYIAESVFSIPRFGMINIHTEILPRFQGALGVIWPIHEGIRETGFTIHQVNRKIDAGAIVYQEKFPIRFFPTLEETVRWNLNRERERLPEAFSHVCEHYEELLAKAQVQPAQKTYTTPTYREFRRMVRNHARMYQEALAEASSGWP
ncbi:MAG: formyltransferase family protein [Phycisphaerales bacterium]